MFNRLLTLVGDSLRFSFIVAALPIAAVLVSLGPARAFPARAGSRHFC
jgi:hypothetical protein